MVVFVGLSFTRFHGNQKEICTLLASLITKLTPGLWSWKYYVSPQLRQASTRPQGITFQKTVLFRCKATYDKITKWQQQTSVFQSVLPCLPLPVKDTSRLPSSCLLCQPVFPDIFKLILRILDETIISKCLSTAITCKNVTIEGVSMGTGAKYGNCQTLRWNLY
jgi:hypothetical protein